MFSFTYHASNYVKERCRPQVSDPGICPDGSSGLLGGPAWEDVRAAPRLFTPRWEDHP